MSVRCPPSVFYLSGAYLRNNVTYLGDICYVGGARAEVVHAEFWAWHMPIKYLFLRNRMPHLVFFFVFLC